MISKYDAAKMKILQLLNIKTRVHKLLRQNLATVHQVLMNVPADVAQEWHQDVASWKYQYAETDDLAWDSDQYIPTQYSSNQSYPYWNAPSTSQTSISNFPLSRYVWTSPEAKKSNSKSYHPNGTPPAESENQVKEESSSSFDSFPEYRPPARVPSRKRSFFTNNSPSDADDEDDEKNYKSEEPERLKRLKSVKVEEDSESSIIETNIPVVEFDQFCVKCLQLHKSGECSKDSNNVDDFDNEEDK